MSFKLTMYFLGQAIPHKLWQFVTATAAAAMAWVFPSAGLVESFYGAFALIAFDTLTGVLAAAKEGRAISSKGFGRVIAKLCGYASAVATVSIATKFLPGLTAAREAAINAVLVTIIATEALSVLENAHRINPQYGVPQWLAKWLRDRVNEEPQQQISQTE